MRRAFLCALEAKVIYAENKEDMRYPEFSIPEKIPMPRPVDKYFADWQGPMRPEFRDDIDISKYDGNQKWLMWCLEQFLNMVDETEEDLEMIDKKYCMSSYMAFRYIEKDDVDFYKNGGCIRTLFLSRMNRESSSIRVMI